MKFVTFTKIVVGIFGLVFSNWGFAQGQATQTICADGTDVLCSTLPTDMADHPALIGYIPDTNAGPGSGGFNQTFVDYFGWQAFVALNWPTDENGQPSKTETIVSDTSSPRVWSTYKTKSEVFGSSAALMAEEECPVNSNKLNLFRTSKFELSSYIEAFTPFPLIDQNGNYVLYDVRLNDREVSYLQTHNLTTPAGQKAWGKPYSFPGGLNKDVGAMEIKTAWKILTDSDNSADYYSTAAQIMVPAEHTVSGETLCIEAEVGLVGMHIMQKFSTPTDFSEYWAWASFEHINNAPLADGAPVSQLNDQSSMSSLAPTACSLNPKNAGSTDYAFYDPDCNSNGAQCELNQGPKALLGQKYYAWESEPPYAKPYMTQGSDRLYGTQVARCWDIYPSAKAVTHNYVKQFGDSVWKKYMMIGVQWAAASNTGGGPFAKLMPFPAPIYMANSVLETYVQTGSVEDPGNGAGSCIICHSLAVDTAGNDANFSFLPGSAKN